MQAKSTIAILFLFTLLFPYETESASIEVVNIDGIVIAQETIADEIFPRDIILRENDEGILATVESRVTTVTWQDIASEEGGGAYDSLLENRYYIWLAAEREEGRPYPITMGLYEFIGGPDGEGRLLAEWIKTGLTLPERYEAVIQSLDHSITAKEGFFGSVNATAHLYPIIPFMG